MRSVLFLFAAALPALLVVGCDDTGDTSVPTGDACPVDISGAEVVTGELLVMDGGTYLVCAGGSLTSNGSGSTIVIQGGSVTTNGGDNDVWIDAGAYTGNGDNDMISEAGGSIVINGSGEMIEACDSIAVTGASCP